MLLEAFKFALPARRSKSTNDSDVGITSAAENVDRTVREVDRISDQRMIKMLYESGREGLGEYGFERTSLER